MHTVFVRKSSNEAKPNQYLFDNRLLTSFDCASDNVTLFSVNESIVINSAPYLCVCACRRMQEREKTRARRKNNNEINNTPRLNK